MPYITDKNDNHILDENGNKIEFIVEHIQTDDWYKHKEEIHLNNDGHFDTENRHIIVKEGIDNNHAVCKSQLEKLNTDIKEYINIKISSFQNSINNNIQNQIKSHEAKILTQILNFRNEQIKNTFHRKIMKLPKKTSTWIKLLSYDDLPFKAEDLTDIMIFNVWLKRYTMFHHGNCVTCQESFGILEYYYDQDMKNFFIYFTKIPDNWSMDCLIEYTKIPKSIKIGEEILNFSNENIHNNKYIPEINVVEFNNN